jgi:amino acid permease
MLFPLSTNLRNPTEKRFHKIAARVHLFEITAYVAFGLTAYLLLLEHIDDHKIDSLVIASIPVVPMTIGKMLMLITLFLAIPLNMFPSR